MNTYVARKESIGVMAVVSIYLLMLVFVGRLADLHPIFSFRGLGFMSVFISVCTAITARRKQSLRAVNRISPLFKYVFIFMGMAYLSIPFSVWVSGAIDKGLAYLYTVAFFFLILMLAKGEHGLRTLLGSGLLVFVTASVMLVKSNAVGRVSVFASSYDPNDIAYILTSLLPLIYYSMQMTRNKAVKLIGYGAIPLSIVAIAMTQSRGATLAFVAILLMFLRFEKVSMRFVLMGIMLAIVAMFFLPDAFWERMSTLTNIESDYNYTSEDGRLAIWRDGIGMFLSNPVTGVGVGQFSAAHFMAGHPYLTAHNAFVQISAELGVVGIVCYLFMTLGPFKSLKRRNDDPAMKSRPHYPLYRGLYLAFWGQFVGSLFLSVGYFFYLYYLLIVFFVLSTIDFHLDRQESEEPVAAETPASVPPPTRRGYTMARKASYKMRSGNSRS